MWLDGGGGWVLLTSSNASGQLGDGAFTSRQTPTLVAAPAGVTFTQIAISKNNHSCGVTAAGAVYCWGAGGQGQLGIGVRENRPTPALVSVPAGLTFTQIAVGNGHSCGLTSAGAAYCWGFGGNGALGTGTITDDLTPALIALQRA